MTREEAITELNTFKIGAKSELGKNALDMAIKALEQEPCKDAISRELALREIDKYMCGVPFEKTLDVVIQELPPVTPKARWIPCNERLPKENEYIGDVCKYYLIQDEYGDMHVAHLSKVGWIPMDSLKAIGNEIVAWMPLPEPYKAESEDKE